MSQTKLGARPKAPTRTAARLWCDADSEAKAAALSETRRVGAHSSVVAVSRRARCRQHTPRGRRHLPADSRLARAAAAAARSRRDARRTSPGRRCSVAPGARGCCALDGCELAAACESAAASLRHCLTSNGSAPHASHVCRGPLHGIDKRRVALIHACAKEVATRMHCSVCGFVRQRTNACVRARAGARAGKDVFHPGLACTNGQDPRQTRADPRGCIRGRVMC